MSTGQAQAPHLEGSERLSALSTSSCSLRLFWTINCARSPTTLDDGVTLTMSPSARLACAYAVLTFSHCSPRPSDSAYARSKLVSSGR